MYKPGDFKISKSKLVYDHFLRVRQDIVLAPNGVKVDYNYVDVKTGAVIILPVHGNKIVMIRQYRYPLKKYIYDLPGGGIKEGKTRLATAKEELKEETGFSAKTFRYINSFYHMPGMANSVVWAYLAKDLAKGDKQPEDSEFMQVIEFDFLQFEKLILHQKVEGTIAAVYSCAKLKGLI